MGAIRSWFSRRAPAAPAPSADALDAYKEGSVDERQRLEKDVPPTRAARADIDAAYDRGRRDERARRRGSPLLAFLLLILAVAAGLMIYLAVRQGSFAAAGAVIDNALSSTAQRATAPVTRAADTTGSALVNAGQSLKERAGSGQQ
jgi:hypothetical protein